MKFVILFLLLIVQAVPAWALCTTASPEQDRREADVVVRVLVVAETVVADDEPSQSFIARWGRYSPMALHRLRVIEVFKGRPGPSISLLEEVSSGRYGVDLGKEYLLYLTYYRSEPGQGTAAKGAMYVKHTCGQSKPWNEVKAAELVTLRKPAAGH